MNPPNIYCRFVGLHVPLYSACQMTSLYLNSAVILSELRFILPWSNRRPLCNHATCWPDIYNLHDSKQKLGPQLSSKRMLIWLNWIQFLKINKETRYMFLTYSRSQKKLTFCLRSTIVVRNDRLRQFIVSFKRGWGFFQHVQIKFCVRKNKTVAKQMQTHRVSILFSIFDICLFNHGVV